MLGVEVATGAASLFSIVILLTYSLFMFTMSRGVMTGDLGCIRGDGDSSSTLYRELEIFSLDLLFDLVLGLILLDWRYESQRVLLSEPGHPESASVLDAMLLMELEFDSWRSAGLLGLGGRLP